MSTDSTQPRNSLRDRAAPVDAALGRADLLRAHLELGEDGAMALARRIGFERRQDPGESSPALSKAPQVHRDDQTFHSPPPAVTGAPEAFAPVPTWRQEVVSDRPSDADLAELDAPSTHKGLRREDLARPDEPEPASPPIVAWPRLRRVLDRALRTPRPGHAVDVDRLVEGWSRGRVFRRLPRRPSVATARLALILDGSPRLMPTWDDQIRLAATLTDRESADRVRRLAAPDVVGADARPVLAEDEIGLALSDLGAYGGERDRAGWIRFARRARARGESLLALSPCPSDRWPGAAEELWSAIDWERPRIGSARAIRRSPHRGPTGPAAGLGPLLAALSPAVRVEPGLLRALRLELARRGRPLGLDAEVEVWRHPQVRGGSCRAVSLELEHAARWQERFAAFEPELRDELARILLAWHRHLPPDLRCLEILNLVAAGVPAEVIGEEDVETAEKTFAAAAASLESGGELADQVEPWTERLLRRAPRSAGRAPGFRPHLARLGRELRRRTGKLEGIVLTPEMLAGEGSGAVPRMWRAWQVGERLELRARGVDGIGSPLAEIIAREELAVSGVAAASSSVGLEEQPLSAPLPSPGGPIVLTSDVEDLRLEPFERPRWASAAGRDRFGLWAAISVEDDAGDDVQHRLRWIPPGRFLMGSPEDEEGRYDDEGPRHEVVISRGLWLGETPCTQDLWQAVMGENRSQFRSPRRPVETVSWEDTETFFERLADRSGGFVARLPTEAEWEYACRAGTSTATYAGELEIRGQSYAPVLDAIAWYGGNSGVGFDLKKGWDATRWSETQYDFEKAGSRKVAEKRPNSWGLFDMLGNVLEWCGDGWANRYDVASLPRVDPVASEDGSYRVIRGGSWFDGARVMRAASRRRYYPSVRTSLLGFRLARGQGEAELGSRAAARRSGIPARQGEKRTGSAGSEP